MCYTPEDDQSELAETLIKAKQGIQTSHSLKVRKDGHQKHSRSDIKIIYGKKWPLNPVK